MTSHPRFLATTLCYFLALNVCYASITPNQPKTTPAPQPAVTTPAEENTAANPENAPKIKSYPVYEDINLISKQDVQYEKPRIVIRSLIPQLVSDENDAENITAFNNAVTELVTAEINQFKQQVKDSLPAGKKGSNDLTIDYNTAAITSGEIRIISIRFNFQGYIVGMAHPFNYHRVLNFDLENNQPLQLGELFSPDADYLNFLSTYARTSLNRKLQDTSLVEEGTTPKADNFNVWNLKPTGLMFTFDEARVAPRVYGVQTVIIPYDLLKHITPRNSPIGPCVYFHRSCGRDTLLTGGFIDEAANVSHRGFNPLSRNV